MRGKGLDQGHAQAAHRRLVGRDDIGEASDLVAGDAEPTLEQVSVGSADGRIAVSDAGPGDGTVLRSSVLLNERVGNTWSPQLITPLDFHSALLLPNDHLGSTRDEVFRDNVLFWLLEDPGGS